MIARHSRPRGVSLEVGVRSWSAVRSNGELEGPAGLKKTKHKAGKMAHLENKTNIPGRGPPPKAKCEMEMPCQNTKQATHDRVAAVACVYELLTQRARSRLILVFYIVTPAWHIQKYANKNGWILEKRST